MLIQKTIETSLLLAKAIGVPHKKVMKFYWQLENHIVRNRQLIRCTVNIVERGENFLRNMSPSLIFAILAKFEKTFMLDDLITWVRHEEIDLDAAKARSFEKPVLIDFYSDTCAPCKVLAPQLEKLAEERGFELLKADSKIEPSLAGALSVRSVPFLVLYHKGEIVLDAGRVAGEVEVALDKIEWKK